ncbi:efflux RND transporter permease subunit [Thalassotalea ganghwensis]
MNLPKLSVNNAQFTITIVVLMVLVGLVSYFTMPRSEDPQFDLPITIIEVIYPGASPSDIETLVVDEIEKELEIIENIKKVEATINNDGVKIEVTFLYGVDPVASYNEVKNAIASIEHKLPKGVQDLLVLKATPTSVAITQIALWNEPANYKVMEFYAKQLEKRLEALSGVQKADIWGYPQQVVAINLNLSLLKHHNISIAQISKVLEGRSLNITPGFVDASTRRFNVKGSGNFTNFAQLEETIIQSNQDFALRLKDVATIEFGDQKPNYLAYYNDKPVIFITAQQRAGTNIFDLTNSIDAELKRFQKTLPDTIKMETLFKQADSVESRVNGFFVNLWQGLIIVGLVALAFLGLRESIVVITAVPLSFLIAMGWLDFLGFGLQQMSIVGLIIALGLLVDNAIVVTESIHRERQRFPALKDAAISGASRVGMAITSGTVTTMLAFLPMLMLASNTGDFVRSMPITVVLVLLASLIIALTLTPMLASRFFTKKPSNIKMLQHYVSVFAEKYYAPALHKLLRVKFLVIVVAIIFLLGLLSLLPQVGVSLFPKAEKPMLLIDVETPPNSTLMHTKSVMDAVAQAVKQHSLVSKVALNVGNSNPRIYYNEIPKRGLTNFGQVLVVLTEFNEHQQQQLVDNLRQQYQHWPEAKINVKEFTQGPVTDKPITVRLLSESLSDLEKVAKDLATKYHQLAGVVNIDNPIGEPNTELTIAIDYDKAGLTKVDIRQLDLTLQTLLSGTNVGHFKDSNGESYPILVRSKMPTLEGLDDITLHNEAGQPIPLSHIVDKKLTKGDASFSHYQKLRMAKVSADVAKGYSINELTTEIVEYLDSYPMPNGMYYVLGGEEESRQESFAGLSQIMIITAVGIFAVLVLQFKSFLQPLIIFTSIPFAIAGSVLGLYIFNLSFSMMAFIGLISLFGIVVNNAIILIDTANLNMKVGFEKLDAVMTASAIRFTPILLTTITTVGGLLPLTLFAGSLWQPLGVVIISGLIVSALSSFLLVPMLTLIFTKDSK